MNQFETSFVFKHEIEKGKFRGKEKHVKRNKNFPELDSKKSYTINEAQEIINNLSRKAVNQLVTDLLVYFKDNGTSYTLENIRFGAGRTVNLPLEFNAQLEGFTEGDLSADPKELKDFFKAEYVKQKSKSEVKEERSTETAETEEPRSLSELTKTVNENIDPEFSILAESRESIDEVKEEAPLQLLSKFSDKNSDSKGAEVIHFTPIQEYIRFGSEVDSVVEDASKDFDKERFFNLMGIPEKGEYKQETVDFKIYQKLNGYYTDTEFQSIKSSFLKQINSAVSQSEEMLRDFSIKIWKKDYSEIAENELSGQLEAIRRQNKANLTKHKSELDNAFKDAMDRLEEKHNQEILTMKQRQKSEVMELGEEYRQKNEVSLKAKQDFVSKDFEGVKKDLVASRVKELKLDDVKLMENKKSDISQEVFEKINALREDSNQKITQYLEKIKGDLEMVMPNIKKEVAEFKESESLRMKEEKYRYELAVRDKEATASLKKAEKDEEIESLKVVISKLSERCNQLFEELELLKKRDESVEEG